MPGGPRVHGGRCDWETESAYIPLDAVVLTLTFITQRMRTSTGLDSRHASYGEPGTHCPEPENRFSGATVPQNARWMIYAHIVVAYVVYFRTESDVNRSG